MRGAVSLAALIVPNAMLSALAYPVDVRAPLPLPGILASLGVKEGRVPERWLRPGALDFSPLHSHALWHTGVWISQTLYLAIFTDALRELAAPPESSWLASWGAWLSGA